MTGGFSPPHPIPTPKRGILRKSHLTISHRTRCRAAAAGVAGAAPHNVLCCVLRRGEREMEAALGRQVATAARAGVSGSLEPAAPALGRGIGHPGLVSSPSWRTPGPRQLSSRHTSPTVDPWLKKKHL